MQVQPVDVIQGWNQQIAACKPSAVILGEERRVFGPLASTSVSESDRCGPRRPAPLSCKPYFDQAPTKMGYASRAVTQLNPGGF